MHQPRSWYVVSNDWLVSVNNNNYCFLGADSTISGPVKLRSYYAVASYSDQKSKFNFSEGTILQLLQKDPSGEFYVHAGCCFFFFFFVPSAMCSFCILDLIMAEVCAWNNFFLHTCMSSVQHEQCRKNLFEAVLGEVRATQTLKECNIKFSGYHTTVTAWETVMGKLHHPRV